MKQNDGDQLNQVAAVSDHCNDGLVGEADTQKSKCPISQPKINPVMNYTSNHSNKNKYSHGIIFKTVKQRRVV